jgi:HAD superfamily phosphatase (TIGR01681 family)
LGNKERETFKLAIFDLDDTLHPLQRNYNQTTCLDSEIIDILTFLKKNNVKIALATLNVSGRQYLIDYNVYHLFDSIRCRSSMYKCKTEIDRLNHSSGEKTFMYREILKELNIKPQDTVVFDDRNFHCIEAFALDMKSIQLNTLLNWSHIKESFDMF